MDKGRIISESLPAVAESILALIGAVALTMVFTVPMVKFQAVYSLPPGADTTQETLDDLVRRLEERGIGRSVEVVGGPALPRLIVGGRSMTELVVDKVPAILEQAGLGARESFRPKISVGDLLEQSAPLALSVQAVVFLVIGVLLIRFRVRRAVAWPAPRPARIALLGLAGGAAAFVVSLTVGAVMNLIGIPVQEQEWARQLLGDRASLLRLVPWIVVVVPLSEEVFFRGYVLRFLSQRGGVPIGLAVSTALFALVHFNPSGILVYLSIGAVLAWVYLRSGSIVAPICAHMIYNGLVLVASLMIPPP
jgi:membrane protease YdiL (CAAX protease family)